LKKIMNLLKGIIYILKFRITINVGIPIYI
jgi:hypothetical protein